MNHLLCSLWIPVMALCLLSASSGCSSWVVPLVFYAPNKGESPDRLAPSTATKLKRLGIDREFHVSVGPPDAVLRLWVVEPKIKSDSEDNAGGLPKATILQLHGYRNESFWMRGMARGMARQGFRVVMVDMRGHGGSSGDYISYGVIESRDMVQVIDELQRRGIIVGPLGVWGISMGASTAIQLAAMDGRVQRVVAVAPYTTMRQIVPHVLRTTLPVYGWFMSDETIAQRVKEGGQIAGFNPDDADTLAAMQKVSVPILIIHGKMDWIVPPDHGRRLHEAGPQISRLVELGWTGHIMAHFSDKVAELSNEWFCGLLTRQSQETVKGRMVP